MRLVGVMLVVATVSSLAVADDKALKAYEGQVVISPDSVPTTGDQLPAFLKANATKDHSYELIKGPPWDINLVGVLSKDPGTSPVTLVIVEKVAKKPDPKSDKKTKAKKADAPADKPADKPPEPLLSIELTSKRQLVV